MPTNRKDFHPHTGEQASRRKVGVLKIFFITIHHKSLAGSEGATCVTKYASQQQPSAQLAGNEGAGGMPRGQSDGFSPYKRPDGRVLRLLKSSNSRTGYYNVVEQHPGKFYPKKKLDGVPGSKSMKVFGKHSSTPREAAIKLAEYLDEPYTLPEAPGRRPEWKHKRLEEWKSKRLEELSAEAYKLLGVTSLDELPPAPELIEAPSGEVLVHVECMWGAAEGAPTVPSRFLY